MPVERLLSHPRLPLIAGWDTERPAVRVWAVDSERLREIGVVGSGQEPYGDVESWDRADRAPDVAWHPAEAVLVVAYAERALRWTPAGVTDMESVPPGDSLRNVAFSPDGRALWVTPSPGEKDGWETSLVIDLDAGGVRRGPGWDTGVVAHPAGGLVVTQQSDQGATVVLFARVDDGVLRPQRRALVLDCDGYETPVFSSDGRHFAVRGNAYDNSVDVFAFPSLRRAGGMTLGPPSPGFPYPPEWLEEMGSWSRHSVAFTSSLWIGTPRGVLLECAVDGALIASHEVFRGSGISALAVTAAGRFVVAGRGGELVLMPEPGMPPEAPDAGAPDAEAAQHAASDPVTEFFSGTSDAPDGFGLDEGLSLTDGTRDWEAEDLDTITEADESDPSWLQIQAHMNRLT